MVILLKNMAVGINRDYLDSTEFLNLKVHNILIAKMTPTSNLEDLEMWVKLKKSMLRGISEEYRSPLFFEYMKEIDKDIFMLTEILTR